MLHARCTVIFPDVFRTFLAVCLTTTCICLSSAVPAHLVATDCTQSQTTEPLHWHMRLATGFHAASSTFSPNCSAMSDRRLWQAILWRCLGVHEIWEMIFVIRWISKFTWTEFAVFVKCFESTTIFSHQSRCYFLEVLEHFPACFNCAASRWTVTLTPSVQGISHHLTKWGK